MSRLEISQYSKLFDLSNKTAIVTGGAGVLGVVFCSALAAHGANVALVDLNKSDAEKAASLIQGNVIGFGCDVSDTLSVKKLVDDVVKEFGEINILHNNAATKSEDLSAFFAPFEKYSLSEWRKIMSVNLDGMFIVDQLVGAQMINQKTGGAVIHTSSIYGVIAPDQRVYEGSDYMGLKINTPAVYAASKAGVIGLSRYLATYWAQHGIRVNTLTPGGVESGQNKEFQDRYSSRVPLGRMAERLDLAGALIYLASDASKYVTGQNLIVDGGLTCW
jgi:NAD(P)-dependent dehydrogenase (short-subunit alcohol dehydrogenase family)